MANRPDIQIYATDNLVSRNSISRAFVAVASLILTFGIPYVVGQYILGNLFSLGWLGGYFGLAAGFWVLNKTWRHFVIQNDSLQAFVTIDQLWTFFRGSRDAFVGDKKVYVSYGPGLHLCFPWESRTDKNNVPLEEVSESFAVTAQTTTGTVTFKGSLRMRADIRYLVNFIGGVAAIPSDITDLIKAFIIQWVSNKTIDQVLTGVEDLNGTLTKKFGLTKEGGDPTNKDEGVADFEKRFGINVSDVTIAEVIPSAEVQKTRSAIDEAMIITEGTAYLLGFKADDPSLPYAKKASDKAADALAQNTLTRAEYARARDRFMAASDNIRMTANTHEITVNVEGLDPDVAAAIAAVAPLIVGNVGKKGGN